MGHESLGTVQLFLEVAEAEVWGTFHPDGRVDVPGKGFGWDIFVLRGEGVMEGRREAGERGSVERLCRPDLFESLVGADGPLRRGRELS